VENLEELKSFYKNKRVFVTGHTGFKGSWLISLLDTLGAKVCGYSLEPATSPNLFEIIKGETIVEHHIGNILDYENLYSVMQSFKPEIVIHMAAQAIVLTSYKNPRETFDVNVMGTVNVLEAVRNTLSVKSFLNVTTDKVYLNNDCGRAFIEADQLCGFDPYSNSKSCSELVTYSYKKSLIHNVAISTARAGNVIGGGDWAEYRLLADCMRCFIKNEPVIIRNPHATRPFQYVLEPLYLYLTIAKKQFLDATFSDSYNIGPDMENCVTVKQIMDCFLKHQPTAEYIVKQDANAKHEAKRLELDNTKIKETFGYKTVYSLDMAIKSIVDWTNAYVAKKDMKKFTYGQVTEFIKQFSKQ